MFLKLLRVASPLLVPTFLSAGYVQINLVSDLPGMAAAVDPNLKNPWGISASAASPFWVSDQGTGKTTLYNGAGIPQSLVVTVPGSGTTPPQGPTGQVFNSSVSGFQLPTGGKATFIFATLGGTVDAWNGSFGTTASVQFTAPDRATYTGLAIGTAGSDFLYAADFRNSKIDVLNSSFAKVSPAGNFIDPNLPAGYSPYNIQAINGSLYVEYARVDPATGRAAQAANTGIVSVFDTNGNFVRRLITNTNLDSPWGIALAPAGFGEFGGDLLVGNFGDGTISAFNPTSGAFQGVVTSLTGNPLVNSGLWGITFHAAAPGFDPNTLYFNAGINNEVNGLFGAIVFAPEPASFGLIMIGLGFGLFRWKALRRAPGR